MVTTFPPTDLIFNTNVISEAVDTVPHGICM